MNSEYERLISLNPNAVLSIISQNIFVVNLLLLIYGIDWVSRDMNMACEFQIGKKIYVAEFEYWYLGIYSYIIFCLCVVWLRVNFCVIYTYFYFDMEIDSISASDRSNVLTDGARLNVSIFISETHTHFSFLISFEYLVVKLISMFRFRSNLVYGKPGN